MSLAIVTCHRPSVGYVPMFRDSGVLRGRRLRKVSEARILAVREATPSVRELDLEVADPAFSFRSGNWVDFFIPGVARIGGYSMCSTPAELPRLRLAVKRSAHPPAAWCHSDGAAPGARVGVKARVVSASGPEQVDVHRTAAGSKRQVSFV